MPADSDHLRIRRFVREVLGCACPDHVFSHIEWGRDSAGGARYWVIGGRLLVRLHLIAAEERLARNLPQWIADGVAQRDALGLRRLRLVLAAENPEAVEAPARGIFDRAASALADVHLHVRGLSALRAELGADMLSGRDERHAE